MKIFFILISSLGLFSNLLAQDLHQTFAFARHLEEVKDYEQALLTYHRVLFFGNGAYREQIYRQMGNCYYAIKDFENATRYFDLAYFSESNDSIRTELTFEKTSSLLLNKNFSYAQMELFDLPDSLSDYFAQKRDFYSGITFYGLGAMEVSKSHFLKAVSDNEKEDIQILFQKLEKVEKLNPKKARILSMFVPGLGQVYAGDWRNGINSFAINGALAFLAIQTTLQYSIWDAAISILPWSHRFHMGGYSSAEAIAMDKKESERAKIYSRIIHVIGNSISE